MSRNKVERKYNPAQYDPDFESIPLYRRQCVSFIPSNSTDKVCQCNRLKQEHPSDPDRHRRDEKWEMARHTIKIPTKEQGICLLNGSPYVRCDVETDPVLLEKILLDVWRIRSPTLLIQIAGGHKYFKLRGKMEITLLDDLVKFVSKSNTWLLTDGMNVGIVQLIGQAIRKRKMTKPKEKIVAIGVCNYGCVKNLSDFQRPEHLDMAQIISKDPNLNKKNLEQPMRTGEQNLEMNHTHFILMDDGTIRNFYLGDRRTRLVKTIAHGYAKDKFPVPVVTLLFEGGEDGVKTIYQSLRENIPVIIINNTGRIADYLVRWLSRTKEMDHQTEWNRIINIDEEYSVTEIRQIIKESSNSNPSTNFLPIHSNDLNRSVQNKLKIKFARHINAMHEELIQAINGKETDRMSIFQKSEPMKEVSGEVILMVLFCLQPIVRSKITIFNMNNGYKLQEMILQSVCRTIEGQKPEERQLLSRSDYLLELALDWDCISTAKEWIVQDSLDNIHNQKSIFCRALKNQRHQFVHYFIQLGLQFDEVFFDPKLNPFASRDYQARNKRYDPFISLLYTEEAINREDWLIRDFIKSKNEQNRKVIQSTEDLNDLFQSLVGGYMKPLYYDSQIDEQEDRMGVKRFTNLISPMQDIEQGPLIGSDGTYKELAKDYIIRDLFLWSIVMNYMELAKVFLAHSKDRICAALIATEILSHLRDTCSDAVHGDKKTVLTRWIKYFEQYAIDCIDLCFQNNPEMARLLTIQRVELFGDVTCLQVADDANSQRFAAHPCCRQAENSIWYDKLDSDQYQIRHYLGLLVGLWSLGLLAPCATRFRQLDQNQGQTERILQPYGINYSDPYANQHFQGGIAKKFFQIWQFHQSLHVKFNYHHIQYMCFLVLFSYVLLFQYNPLTDTRSSVHISELFVIIIVCCMSIEEIRVFFNQDSLSFFGKCHSYFRDFFKQLCFLSFLLFYVGLILRFRSLGESSSFLAARIIMGYDLWIWWIRSMGFIIVNPYLGPHLISIGRMLKNLSFFAILIAIVMTAYGVASRSMAFYGTFHFGIREIFHAVLYPVYYLLYTNVSGELQGLDGSINQSSGIATHILLAFHMLLINILLVNLLIAMFNKSFQDIVEVQKDVWSFQQYAVVREYFDRPALFIPISTIFDIITLVKMFYRWYLRVRYNYANPTERVFKVIAVQPELELAWQEFENASTYVYAQREALIKLDRKIVQEDNNGRPDGLSNASKKKDSDQYCENSLGKEKDQINQLRREFKAAIKDLRNDIRLLIKQK